MKRTTALVLATIQLGAYCFAAAPATAASKACAFAVPTEEKPRVLVMAMAAPTPVQSVAGDISAIDSVVSMTTHLLLKSGKVRILDAAPTAEQGSAPMTLRVQVVTLSRDVDSVGGKLPSIPGLPQRTGGQGNLQRLTSRVSVRVEILVGGEIRGSFMGRGSAQATGIAVLPGGTPPVAGAAVPGQVGSVAEVTSGFVKAARPNDEKALTKAIEDALKQAIPALESEARSSGR